MTEEQLPPHSPEAEQGVLGCLFLAPDRISSIAGSLRSDAFFDLRNKHVYEAMLAAHRAGSSIDALTISERLRGEALIEECGGLAYLATLPDFVPTAEHLDDYAETLLSCWQARKFIAHCTTAIQRARDARNGELAAVIADHDAALAEEVRTLGNRHRSTLAAIRFDPQQPPPQAPAVYTLSGVPICTPGNITAVTAAAKAGKSAFLGAMLAAAMARERVDTLGLATANGEGRAVVHVDTEQSPFDHWRLIDRALRRARSEAPPWLYSYRLAGHPARTCFNLLKQALADAAEECDGIHSAHIDGAADLVLDVNDAAESNAFVAELHHLAITYHCPIVAVLHFNPGTDKVRGHLGSQLERKAETNLTLEKDGDVTLVWSAKNRGASIPKERGQRFRWSDQAGMHVTASIDDSPAHQEKLEKLRVKRDDVFHGRGGMRYGELQTTVKKVLTVSDRTAERLIAELLHYRQIEKSVAGLYVPSN